MSKILTTQLSGLLQRITQNEEETIEETARLLAQASVGAGNIYFACFGEMKVVELNALNSVEGFPKLLPWTKDIQLDEADRVCIFTRSAFDEEALSLAQDLNEAFIPFAAVASEVASADNPLADLAYTYISTRIRGGLLPSESGERIVVPHAIAALFIYEAIKIAFDEIQSIDDAW